MPASSKKSPLTTTKKKKATPVPGKNKKNGAVKKGKSKDLVNSKDGSYLNDDSQSMLASVASPPHTVAASSTSVDHTVLSVLARLEQSNSEVMKRLDRLERNNTITSTPASSPQSGPRDNVTFKLPQTKVTSPGAQKLGDLTPHASLLNAYKWPAREGMPAPTSLHPQSRDSRYPGNYKPPAEQEQRRGYDKDAIVPSLERLRAMPHVASTVSDLLAQFETQSHHDVLQGKGFLHRKKSGRYNITDMPVGRPEVRWPNEGFVSSSNSKKPAFDEMNLQQWAVGQLNNALQIDDNTLLRHVLKQMMLALNDSVALPWPAVRAAWAVSMTEVEEGRLQWHDTTQWALNRVSSSQIAVMNGQNVSSFGQKSRICKFYNEGSCSNEGNHGIYRHICSLCSKQGRTSSHPEFKCSFRVNVRSQEVKAVSAR